MRSSCLPSTPPRRPLREERDSITTLALSLAAFFLAASIPLAVHADEPTKSLENDLPSDRKEPVQETLQTTPVARSAFSGAAIGLDNGETLTDLSGGEGSEVHYKIVVPSGQRKLEVEIWGGTGDCDLYVRKGAQPSVGEYDYRPFLSGNDETVIVSDPTEGEWFIMLHGYEVYSGVSLRAAYDDQPETLAEALGIPDAEIDTGGHAPWHVDTGEARSGSITHNQETWIETVFEGPGTLSFEWKVSSEANYDFLEIYLDAERRDRISGESDWEPKSIELGDEVTTVRWRYVKDVSISHGADSGWLRNVGFEAEPTHPWIVAHPSAREVTAPESATFSLSANGSPPLSYQWQRSTDGGLSWSDIPGATNDTYDTGPTERSMNGHAFRCIVSNDEASAVSDSAILTVAEQVPLAEALNIPNTEVISGGNALWRIDAGVARSGTITHDQESWIEAVFEGPGTLSFEWEVSSEVGFDFLEIHNNGERLDQISGESEWNHRSFELEHGSNTVRWVYIKDYSVSDGADSGWLRNVASPGQMVPVEGGVLPGLSSFPDLYVEPFEIASFEVTWHEWKTVRDWAAQNGYDIGNVGDGCADDHPVHSINWFDALKWCNARSEMQGLTPAYTVEVHLPNSTEIEPYRMGEHAPMWDTDADGYRLPTTDEWEFAARGGIHSEGYLFSGSDNLDEVAWYRDNSGGAACNLMNGGGTWPVGKKRPNEIGLYDMSGNVGAWCWNGSSDTNDASAFRRQAGGTWQCEAGNLQLAVRLNHSPDTRDDRFGLRLVQGTNAVDPYGPLGLEFTRTGVVGAGQWEFYEVEVPAEAEGWRVVVHSDSAEPELYLRAGEEPDTSNYDAEGVGFFASGYSSTATVAAEDLSPGAWFVGVRNPENASLTYTIAAEEAPAVRELDWDPGETFDGTHGFAIDESGIGGLHYFRVTTNSSPLGVWRQVLRVDSGEARLFSRSGSNLATPSQHQYSSVLTDIGNGFVFRLSSGQTWHLTVGSEQGADWSLVAGVAPTADLGSLAEDASSGSAAYDAANAGSPAGVIPLEGVRFFRTSIPTPARAWRLWLQEEDGEGTLDRRFFVRKGVLPAPNNSGEWASGTQHDRDPSGQALLVPPLVDPGGGDLYYVAVTGEPGETFQLDSRQQPVADLAFGETSPPAGGHGVWFHTYRVTVPEDVIGWEVTALRDAGEPLVAARRELVPNARENDAYSEVLGGTDNSVTFVPPDIDDGTYFITVYGEDDLAFRLRNREPEITGIDYVSQAINDDSDRAGWRYFAVTDIDQQLGSLGWLLELEQHVPGTRIAIRRNALPGERLYRDDGRERSDDRWAAASDLGFLQHPAHQADIWYVGIFSPDAPLGEFSLDSGHIIPPLQSMDGAEEHVSDLPPETWIFYRIDVPGDLDPGELLGWELRVTEWSAAVNNNARPWMVLRRGALPEGTNANDFGAFNDQPGYNTNWDSGWAWPERTSWWTNRNRSADGEQISEQYLMSFPIGQPIEPGTYYLGFYNEHDDESVSFSWTSKGVGQAGSGLSYEIALLNYENGSASGTLEPREVAYYYVDVPEDKESWEIRLDVPDGNEAALYLRKEYLPNSRTATRPGGIYDPSDPLAGSRSSPGRQIGLEKPGGQRFVQWPRRNEETIRAGRYYLMVVGEGQEPTADNRIGTGPIDYTLISKGEAAVNDLDMLQVAGIVSHNDSYQSGEIDYYRFEVSEGVLALELRLDDRVGDPGMNLHKGRLAPDIREVSNPNLRVEYGQYSGRNATWADGNLITVANPDPGVYTLAVGHGEQNPDYGEGSYSLHIEGVGAAPAQMDGFSDSVANLGPGEWSFYRIDVPGGLELEDLLGWELRVTDWNGAMRPTMVVRRGELPDEPNDSFGSNQDRPGSNTNWENGWQLGESHDWWTRRTWSADGNQNNEQYLLSLPLGQPVEPGTYYVGFHNPDSSESANFSWSSKAAGVPGSGFSYEVAQLDYEGGSVSGMLEPREVAYYHVDIPEDKESWEVRLDVPEGHEAALYIRKDYLPNSRNNRISLRAGSADPSAPLSTSNNRGQTVLRKPGGQRFAQWPRNNEESIRPGRYYLMVVGEGREPSADNRIGTGSIDFTLVSKGEAAVTDLGTLSVAGAVNRADSYEAGEIDYYRFEVPEGMLALELRLEDRVGEPGMNLHEGRLAPQIRRLSNWNHQIRYGQYSGHSPSWTDGNIITVANPDPGVYTLAVGHAERGPDYGEGSYTLNVTGMAAETLAFGISDNTATRELAADQRAFFSLPVSESFDEEEVLGWRLRLIEHAGQGELRVRRGSVPSDSINPEQTSFRRGSMLVVPHLLEPDEWFVEVRGITAGEFELISEPVTLSSLQDGVWPMPVAGDEAPGFTGATISDTGSVDLSHRDFHLYAIEVPEENGGLLRTVLESISGDPDLYIRPGYLPTTDHREHGHQGGDTLYLHRLDNRDQTQYGNWVPFDVREESALDPGLWFIKVRAGGNSSARYRLRISHHADPLVRELAADGGAHEDQTVAAGDWRYFQVTFPENPADMPDEWTVQFSETQGDVVMYVRDSGPPGQWDRNNTSYGTNRQNQNPRDWRADDLDPGNYQRFTSSGTHTIEGRHLRPGKTYYLGFRAESDATFSVGSDVGAGTLGDTYGPVADLSAEGGAASVTLAPGELYTWRIVSPEEAHRWKHTSTHSAEIEVFLREDFFPDLDGGNANFWNSNGDADSEQTRNLSTPRRERDFYLTAVNTGATEHTYTFEVDWREFELEFATVGEGSINRSPSRSRYEPGDEVTLTANPSTGWEFVEWTGDIESTENPVTIEMQADVAVTAHFEPIPYTLTLIAEGGTIAADPDRETYIHGDQVTLTAIPDEGHTFLNWSGDLSGTDNPATLTLTGHRTVEAHFEAPGFETWVREHFTETERADEDISGPEATPAGDAVPNLIKYALGVEPMEPASDALPRLVFVEENGQRYPAIEFTRDPDADVELTLKASPDLDAWDFIPFTKEIIETLPDDRERVRLTAEEPVEDDSHFLRLEVALPEG